jgi:hypothetical protein
VSPQRSKLAIAITSSSWSASRTTWRGGSTRVNTSSQRSDSLGLAEK